MAGQGDPEDDRFTVVVWSEREGADGEVTPVWVTYQPGIRDTRIAYDTLGEAVTVACDHLQPGFPENRAAFDEVMVAILLLTTGDPRSTGRTLEPPLPPADVEELRPVMEGVSFTEGYPDDPTIIPNLLPLLWSEHERNRDLALRWLVGLQ